MYITDSLQIRNAEKWMLSQFDVSGLQLMERAGNKSAEFILKNYPAINDFLILAGPGNNGGDGLVIARCLFQADKSVSIIFAIDPEKYAGDAGVNFKALNKLKINSATWGTKEADKIIKNHSEKILLIDALLGTGFTSSLRSPMNEIIRFFSEKNFPVVAIDLPSGLSADTGKLVNLPLKAEYTLSFGALKICHVVMPAAEYCGKVVTVDIGITDNAIESTGIQRQLITGEWIRTWHKKRAINSHKGSFGHALIVGGSRNMAGAVSLSARAALHIGAGVSSAFFPGAVRNAFFQLGAEVMTNSFGDDQTDIFSAEAKNDFLKAAENKNGIAIGPGMGAEESCAAFLASILPLIKTRLVLDADALNILSNHPELYKLLPPFTILTPHPGEMKRLTGNENVQEERLEIAEAFAKENKVTLVLKGAKTIIAFSDGSTFINTTGNSGMATAGSGDVLTGAITGLLAQGYKISEAVPMAVYIHGIAGDLAAEKYSEEGVTAEGILEMLGPALKSVLEKKENQPLTF